MLVGSYKARAPRDSGGIAGNACLTRTLQTAFDKAAPTGTRCY
jgi:hypothetical protein